MSPIPFFKFFNINMLIQESSLMQDISRARAYKNFNGQPRSEPFTDSEKEIMVKTLEGPIKEMFKFLGHDVEIIKR